MKESSLEPQLSFQIHNKENIPTKYANITKLCSISQKMQ